MSRSGRRFPGFHTRELSAEQRRVVDAVFSRHLPADAPPMTVDDLPDGPLALGPFEALLLDPELADLAQRLGAHLRFDGDVPIALRELAILVTARHWRAEFEWWGHHALALDAGISRDVAAAIGTGRRPDLLSEDEAAVHDFAVELLRDGGVGDATFASIEVRFGARGAAELLSIIGYYTWISFLLNVDRYPSPARVPFEGH